MSCGVKVCIVLLEVFVFVSYFFALTSFSVVAVAAVAAAAATTTATVVNIVMTLIRILKR